LKRRPQKQGQPTTSAKKETFIEVNEMMAGSIEKAKVENYLESREGTQEELP